MEEYGIALRISQMCAPRAVIFDIGANIGLYTIAFAANDSRIVHSFEPSDLALPYLRRNLTLNRLENAHVHAVLLSDSRGQRNFVLDRMTTAQSHVGRSGEVGIFLESVDLDSYAREQLLPSPDLVKIDVEGHDFNVLRGMQQMLKARPMIYLEGGERGEDGRVNSMTYLLERGYGLWNLDRTTRLRPDTREYRFLAIPGG